MILIVYTPITSGVALVFVADHEVDGFIGVALYGKEGHVAVDVLDISQQGRTTALAVAFKGREFDFLRAELVAVKLDDSHDAHVGWELADDGFPELLDIRLGVADRTPGVDGIGKGSVGVGEDHVSMSGLHGLEVAPPTVAVVVDGEVGLRLDDITVCGREVGQSLVDFQGAVLESDTKDKMSDVFYTIF